MWRGLLKLYFLRKLLGRGGRTGDRGGCGCLGSLALIVLVVAAFLLLRSCGGDAPTSAY
ncbi:hypothetical protein [Pontibacter kalidii]|uniref:hypothetical protein n=1 Tax=Pontibacter kalidii TaxID=2592049 RepID=UPI002254433A|nr:hypothetical protein [Pontibacter kalidii]